MQTYCNHVPPMLLSKDDEYQRKVRKMSKTKQRKKLNPKALLRARKREQQKNNKQENNEPQKRTPFWKTLLFIIGSMTIMFIIVFLIMLVVSHFKIQNAGFEDKDELVKTYFETLNNKDKNRMEDCFYPGKVINYDNIQYQINYANSEPESTVWKYEDIEMAWEDCDSEPITEVLGAIQIDESAYCMAIVPLEQTLPSGEIIQQEDLYQFYAHKTKDKWYIAALMQTSRNVTGVIKQDGTNMTQAEINNWLYGLAQEIGDDKVGYLYVDDRWAPVQFEELEEDDQILGFITNDETSYMTMAVINDNDVKDFNEYAENIIKTSSQNYDEMITSEGVVTNYQADVKIAQNTETGARIIIWMFKTDENDEYTHVITLEATGIYDASTYINTFHLTKEKTEEQDNNDAE